MEKLYDLYYNPKYGLSSAQTLYENMNKKIPLKLIKEFLKEQEVNQLHSTTNNKKLFYPIIGRHGSYQADLTFFDKIKRANRGYGVLLTCVNIMTRKAFVKPLKNKSGLEVVKAFEEIIKEAGDMKFLTTDKGTEFISKPFNDMLKKNNVELILADTGDKNKMGKIERFNRTIRGKIEKYMTAFKTNKYIDVLDDLVYNYNHTIHSKTGYAPQDVGKKEEAIIYKEEKKGNREVDRMKNKINYQVGDKVRLIKPKELFEKASGEKYYKGIYTIFKINPMSFRLKNEDGSEIKKRVKHYEIMKIDKVNSYDQDKEDKRDILKTQVKNEKKVKREGLDAKNIIAVDRRKTKQVDGLDPKNILDVKRKRI